MSVAAHLISSHLPTIKQLQCFMAVSHELNFRRAAERLSMTQPPLTRQIQSLEDLLGQSLFSRTTHEVTLTESGRALVGKAEAILSALSALKQEAQPAAARLRIGLTRTLNFELIAPLNEQLAGFHVRDEMEMPSLTSAQLLQSLAKKQSGSDSHRRKRAGSGTGRSLRLGLPRAAACRLAVGAPGQSGRESLAGGAG